MHPFKKIGLIGIFLSIICMSAPTLAETKIAPSVVASAVERIQDASQGITKGDDFGQKVIDWIAHGTVNPTYGTPSLMSTLSSVMNTIALFMMAYLSILSASTFIIQTANKGSPGGQVISSFWMPIRIVTATILLIPLGSGFSSLQYGVISIAEKGNSTGNYLMAAGLDYLTTYGVYRPPLLPSTKAAIYEWVGMEMCAQYINGYTGKETIKTNFESYTQEGRYVNRVIYDNVDIGEAATKKAIRRGYCGSVTTSIETEGINTDNTQVDNGAPPIIRDGQKAMLSALHAKIVPIATKLMADQAALSAMQTEGASKQDAYEKAQAEISGNIDSSASSINAVVIEADKTTQSLVASAATKITRDKNKGADWSEQTKAAGWPALGTIFWQVNVTQSAINKLSETARFTPGTPALDEDWEHDPRLNELLFRATKAVQESKRTATFTTETYDLSSIADAGAEGSGSVDGFKDGIYRFFSGGIKAILFKNSDDDLILNLQYFGSAMSTLAETAFWSKVFISAAVKTAGNAVKDIADEASNSWLAKLIPGSGLFSAAAKAVVNFIVFSLEEILPLINYLIIVLIVVGFTLGVVLPTIPLIQWFMGVISWMLFYIECLLVSPFWLAAHGTAEKEGWGSEHTRQGYMLMIGLYLNPVLRVAGFFAILAALKPVGILVAWMFTYINGVILTGFTGFFMLIGSLIISVVFAYSALTRLFGLPSELFERGLRWINGGQEVTGDSKAEGESRQTIAAFGSKSEGGAMHAARGGAPKLPGEPGGAGGAGGKGMPGAV